jgi:hypothetical protein
MALALGKLTTGTPKKGSGYENGIALATRLELLYNQIWVFDFDWSRLNVMDSDWLDLNINDRSILIFKIEIIFS